MSTKPCLCLVVMFLFVFVRGWVEVIGVYETCMRACVTEEDKTMPKPFVAPHNNNKNTDSSD